MTMRMLKKWISILFIISSITVGLSAFAESPSAPIGGEVIEGVIKEVCDQAILIAPYEGVEVLARIPEGVAIEGPVTLMPGMPVLVTYNGVMTRSIPAQINADAVLVPTLTGVITSVGEKQLLLEQDGGLGPVLVHVTEDSVTPADYCIAEGNRIQVVFSGIMALSMPPQTGAMFILPLPVGE